MKLGDPIEVSEAPAVCPTCAAPLSMTCKGSDPSAEWVAVCVIGHRTPIRYELRDGQIHIVFQEQ